MSCAFAAFTTASTSGWLVMSPWATSITTLPMVARAQPVSLCSGRCVFLAAQDVKRDIWLIADHPAVVPGWYVEEVAGSHHQLAAVVHLRNCSAAQDQPDVFDLARRLTGGLAYVF